MDVEKYLANFNKGTRKLNLNAMSYFLEEFKHPEREFKIIHIAGTNGKGSCTEMMTNILVKAGYKVGKFISPHLIKYNERISIDNKMISDEEMESLINEINYRMEKYKNVITLTFFELETMMALLYFSKNKCDFAVLETGLGGLLDCTNCCNSMISIITSIGYDHMHILGNTLAEIAYQKAGIIKENAETVFVEQEEEVNSVIKETCLEKNNNLHLINDKDILNYSYDERYQKFDYKEYKNILVNLKGKKQCLNATICLECVEILKNKGYEISKEAVIEGLKTVIHKGRFEVISNNPTIVYDGGHNKPAIENLKNTIDMYYKENKKVFVISILKTKDYHSILKELLKYENATFIFTSGNDAKRFVSKEELLNIANEYSKNEKKYAMEIEEVIAEVKEKYQEYVTFIVGSFYIYGVVGKCLIGDCPQWDIFKI